MRVAEGHEVIEAVFVEMVPLQEGFCGVLAELVATGEGYAVVETARSRLIESARARHFNFSWEVERRGSLVPQSRLGAARASGRRCTLTLPSLY